MCNQTEKRELALGLSPNNTLQRSWTHKVLGRGRPSGENAPERWRARVLKGRRAAAELCRYAAL